MTETFVTMRVGDLTDLLVQTQRLHVIGGKQIPQVKGTVINCNGSLVNTCNIVRDGITSIASFYAPADSKGKSLIVADISLLLGALKKHKGVVSLEHENGKLRIISSGKKTTLISDERAKAFPHTKKTIREWGEDSLARFDKCLGNEGNYTLSDGTIIEPSEICTVKIKELLEGIDSGSMNNQKLMQYKFHTEDGCLFISVGGDMKGRTKTLIGECGLEKEVIVGGGLENVLRNAGIEEIGLRFFDLTPHGGGMSLLLHNDGIQLFQREVAGSASD